MANEKIYEIKLPDASYDVFGKGLIYDADETISITYDSTLYDGSWHIISNGLALTRPTDAVQTFSIYAETAENGVFYGYTIEAGPVLTLQQGRYSDGGKIRIDEDISLTGSHIYCNGILNLANASIDVGGGDVGSLNKVLTSTGSEVIWAYPRVISQGELTTQDGRYPILVSGSTSCEIVSSSVNKKASTFTFQPDQDLLTLGLLQFNGKGAVISGPDGDLTISSGDVYLKGTIHANQSLVLTEDAFAYDSSTGTLTIAI